MLSLNLLRHCSVFAQVKSERKKQTFSVHDRDYFFIHVPNTPHKRKMNDQGAWNLIVYFFWMSDGAARHGTVLSCLVQSPRRVVVTKRTCAPSALRVLVAPLYFRLIDQSNSPSHMKMPPAKTWLGIPGWLNRWKLCNPLQSFQSLEGNLGPPLLWQWSRRG